MPHSRGVRASTPPAKASTPPAKALTPPAKVFLAALSVAAVLTAGASCQISSTPGAAQSSSALPTASTANAVQQLKALAVQPNGSMAGYSRERFPHWSGQGGGCDTRDVVLKRDGQNVQATTDCKIFSGTWFSVYDSKRISDPQGIDIDHMVPLAAGWRSGASKWTEDQRALFANDLTRPQLLAVSATSNRAKGDQDPSQWKPPNHGYWCQYAQNWITVKSFYMLTVTRDEKAALSDMLGTC